MADPSYLDYEEDPDLNGVGQASKTRFAEGWKGYLVNDAMRWLAAAFRRLGDRTLFTPGTEGAPASQLAGSMAMQNADAVAITGGVADGLRGVMPIRSVIDWYGTWTEFLAVYDSQLQPAGWVYADGRPVTNPITGQTVTAPNLTGRYRMFLDNTSAVGTGAAYFGSNSRTTEFAGGHSHGGVTGSTVLTVNQIPLHGHTYTRTTGSFGTSGGGGLGNGASDTSGLTGGGQGHEHSIASVGDHLHTIADVRPLSVMTIPLIRLW